MADGRALGRRDGERTRLTIGEAVLVEALARARIGQGGTMQDVEALRARLRSYGGTAAVEEPASFVGALRPYQRDGLRWFAMLRELGLGGCLADDMGLGKTVMVLAWLDRLRAVGRVAAEPRSSFRGRWCSTGARKRAVSRQRSASWISRTRRARPITAACPRRTWSSAPTAHCGGTRRRSRRTSSSTSCSTRRSRSRTPRRQQRRRPVRCARAIASR